MFHIKLLDSDDELNDVGKLRYDVYVSEMHRNQLYVDDCMRTIIEPEDFLPSVRIIVAYYGSELVATSRIRIYYAKSDTGQLDCYNIPEIVRNNLTLSEGTKFIIKKALRGNAAKLGVQMMAYAYDILLREKIDIDILNANDYLVHYYEKRGYRVFGEKYLHHELNQIVYPMALLVKDFFYLEKIRSPLYSIMKTKHIEEDNRKNTIAQKIFS